MDRAVAEGWSDGSAPVVEQPERDVIRRRKRSRSYGGNAGKRLDIQGLRMVAVMLVVISHLFDGAHGALVGVDVFFVISGFLITGLLVRELNQTSRVSLAGFYRRRIKRIVPAATLVLIAISVASYFCFAVYRFKQTVVDAAWAFLFAANWRFAGEGTDYLKANGPVSPVQHYWSLSVEEQFYFVWPGLILVIGVITGRGWIRGRVALAVSVMGVVVAASLAYALVELGINPAFAYFSSLSRVWELGVGAMLAITASYAQRIPEGPRPFILWIGLVAIAIGAFAPSRVEEFPLWRIAMAVAGAGMVIVAGTGKTPRYATVLTNRVSVYVGDISYSLYLWHWPVIVFIGLLMPGGVYFRLAAILLMFGLAIAAYEFYEDPIRRSDWLARKTVGNGRHDDHRKGTKRSARAGLSLQVAGAISLALVTGGGVVLAVTPAPSRSSAQAPVPISDGKPNRADVEPENRAAKGPEQATLSKEISDALGAQEWPALSPSLDEVVSGNADSYIKECMFGAGKSITDCTLGDPRAPHAIVLVGDSTSMSYAGAFEAIAHASNGQWRVELRNFIGCSFMAGNYRLPDFVDEVKEEACPSNVESTIGAIEAERPDVVVVTNGYWPHEAADDGRAQSLAEREKSIQSVVFRIAKSSGKVVLMAPPPYSQDTRRCYTKLSTPSDCIGSVPQWWPDYEAVDKDVVAGLDNASFIGTWPWFCSQDERCPAFVETVPIRYDSHHLTGAFSRRLGPVVREAFSDVGLAF